MKKLMVAAAVALSAMVGFSVESANIVGYQTLTIKPGWNMLAVNFKDVNNTEGILLKHWRRGHLPVPRGRSRRYSR